MNEDVEMIFRFSNCFICTNLRNVLEKTKTYKKNNNTLTDFTKPGNVLLSHVLRRSTIAAGDFRFPVRDGMERGIPRYGHQAK